MIGRLSTRGSDMLTREIRDRSATYERVIVTVCGDQRPRIYYVLDCEHTGTDNERNPAYVGQMRYCPQCTGEKLRVTGD